MSGGRSDEKSDEDAPQQKREEKRKLSYKQKFALETLPGKMDALAKEIAVLEGKLADPQLYAKDPALLPRPPIFLRRSAPKMPPWKKNGSSLKCCEKKSKGKSALRCLEI